MWPHKACNPLPLLTTRKISKDLGPFQIQVEPPDLRWHQEIIIYTNKITNNQVNHSQPQDQVQNRTMYHLPKLRHLFSYRCPLHLPPRHLATMDIPYPL